MVEEMLTIGVVGLVSVLSPAVLKLGISTQPAFIVAPLSTAFEVALLAEILVLFQFFFVWLVSFVLLVFVFLNEEAVHKKNEVLFFVGQETLSGGDGDLTGKSVEWLLIVIAYTPLYLLPELLVDIESWESILMIPKTFPTPLDNKMISDTVPYRVIVTGVPLHLSCDCFYDYLRAHTGDRGLYNALLIASSASVEPRSGKRKNVGAAFVDFCSKAHADAALRSPFCIGDAQLQWKPIGRVHAGTVAAGHIHQGMANRRVEGRNAYSSRRHVQQTRHSSTLAERRGPTKDDSNRGTLHMPISYDPVTNASAGATEVTLRLQTSRMLILQQIQKRHQTFAAKANSKHNRLKIPFNRYIGPSILPHQNCSLTHHCSVSTRMKRNPTPNSPLRGISRKYGWFALQFEVLQPGEVFQYSAVNSLALPLGDFILVLNNNNNSIIYAKGHGWFALQFEVLQPGEVFQYSAVNSLALPLGDFILVLNNNNNSIIYAKGHGWFALQFEVLQPGEVFQYSVMESRTCSELTRFTSGRFHTCFVPFSPVKGAQRNSHSCGGENTQKQQQQQYHICQGTYFCFMLPQMRAVFSQMFVGGCLGKLIKSVEGYVVCFLCVIQFILFVFAGSGLFSYALAMRSTLSCLFRVSSGKVLVDYKLVSRDHKKSISVKDAVVDPALMTTVVPYSWLERLRSPSLRLPTGYFLEKKITCGSSYEASKVPPKNVKTISAVQAGPVVVYISGQSVPVVLNPWFVPESEFNFSQSSSPDNLSDEVDLRIGLDGIEQCSLLAELRPGGLLYSQLPIHGDDVTKSTEPAYDTFRRYGMKCGLSDSPLNRRPWTRMKYMFVDELQRGPKLTEFVGYNPRSGTPWRFSQHNRYFRQGIWKEIVRRNEMNPGLHSHSSWQKSHQQSVPESIRLGHDVSCIFLFLALNLCATIVQFMIAAGRTAHDIGKGTPTPRPLTPSENQGLLNGPNLFHFQSCLAEPLESWLSIMADAVPFYKDTVVVCPSSFDESARSSLRRRCQAIFPRATVEPLRLRLTRRSRRTPNTSGTEKNSALPPAVRHQCQYFEQTWCSPLEKLPPQSQDVIVFAGNVFGREMLFQGPSHITAAHRVLRPHGVLAILGYSLDCKVAVPDWARCDADDFLTTMKADATALEHQNLDTLCHDLDAVRTMQQRQLGIQRAKSIMSSISCSHTDIYLPFPAVKRRWFESEYAMSPAELASCYASIPFYAPCYAPTLWGNGGGSSSCKEDFVSLPALNLRNTKSTSSLVVRKTVDPLEMLLSFWETHRHTRRAQRGALRARVLHFTLTCSSRGMNSIHPSSTGRFSSTCNKLFFLKYSPRVMLTIAAVNFTLKKESSIRSDENKGRPRTSSFCLACYFSITFHLETLSQMLWLARTLWALLRTAELTLIKIDFKKVVQLCTPTVPPWTGGKIFASPDLTDIPQRLFGVDEFNGLTVARLWLMFSVDSCGHVEESSDDNTIVFQNMHVDVELEEHRDAAAPAKPLLIPFNLSSSTGGMLHGGLSTAGNAEAFQHDLLPQSFEWLYWATNSCDLSFNSISVSVISMEGEAQQPLKPPTLHFSSGKISFHYSQCHDYHSSSPPPQSQLIMKCMPWQLSSRLPIPMEASVEVEPPHFTAFTLQLKMPVEQTNCAIFYYAHKKMSMWCQMPLLDIELETISSLELQRLPPLQCKSDVPQYADAGAIHLRLNVKEFNAGVDGDNSVTCTWSELLLGLDTSGRNNGNIQIKGGIFSSGALCSCCLRDESEDSGTSTTLLISMKEIGDITATIPISVETVGPAITSISQLKSLFTSFLPLNSNAATPQLLIVADKVNLTLIDSMHIEAENAPMFFLHVAEVKLHTKIPNFSLQVSAAKLLSRLLTTSNLQTLGSFSPLRVDVSVTQAMSDSLKKQFVSWDYSLRPRNISLARVIFGGEDDPMGWKPFQKLVACLAHQLLLKRTTQNIVSGLSELHVFNVSPFQTALHIKDRCLVLGMPCVKAKWRRNNFKQNAVVLVPLTADRISLTYRRGPDTALERPFFACSASNPHNKGTNGSLLNFRSLSTVSEVGMKRRRLHAIVRRATVTCSLSEDAIESLRILHLVLQFLLHPTNSSSDTHSFDIPASTQWRESGKCSVAVPIFSDSFDSLSTFREPMKKQLWIERCTKTNHTIAADAQRQCTESLDDPPPLDDSLSGLQLHGVVSDLRVYFLFIPRVEQDGGMHATDGRGNQRDINPTEEEENPSTEVLNEIIALDKVVKRFWSVRDVLNFVDLRKGSPAAVLALENFCAIGSWADTSREVRSSLTLSMPCICAFHSQSLMNKPLQPCWWNLKRNHVPGAADPLEVLVEQLGSPSQLFVVVRGAHIRILPRAHHRLHNTILQWLHALTSTNKTQMKCQLCVQEVVIFPLSVTSSLEPGKSWIPRDAPLICIRSIKLKDLLAELANIYGGHYTPFFILAICYTASLSKREIDENGYGGFISCFSPPPSFYQHDSITYDLLILLFFLPNLMNAEITVCCMSRQLYTVMSCCSFSDAIVCYTIPSEVAGIKQSLLVGTTSNECRGHSLLRSPSITAHYISMLGVIREQINLTFPDLSLTGECHQMLKPLVFMPIRFPANQEDSTRTLHMETSSIFTAEPDSRNSENGDCTVFQNILHVKAKQQEFLASGRLSVPIIVVVLQDSSFNSCYIRQCLMPCTIPHIVRCNSSTARIAGFPEGTEFPLMNLERRMEHRTDAPLTPKACANSMTIVTSCSFIVHTLFFGKICHLGDFLYDKECTSTTCGQTSNYSLWDYAGHLIDTAIKRRRAGSTTQEVPDGDSTRLRSPIPVATPSGRGVNQDHHTDEGFIQETVHRLKEEFDDDTNLRSFLRYFSETVVDSNTIDTSEFTNNTKLSEDGCARLGPRLSVSAICDAVEPPTVDASLIENTPENSCFCRPYSSSAKHLLPDDISCELGDLYEGMEYYHTSDDDLATNPITRCAKAWIEKFDAIHDQHTYEETPVHEAYDAYYDNLVEEVMSRRIDELRNLMRVTDVQQFNWKNVESCCSEAERAGVLPLFEAFWADVASEVAAMDMNAACGATKVKWTGRQVLLYFIRHRGKAGLATGASSLPSQWKSHLITLLLYSEAMESPKRDPFFIDESETSTAATPSAIYTESGNSGEETTNCEQTPDIDQFTVQTHYSRWKQDLTLFRALKAYSLLLDETIVATKYVFLQKWLEIAGNSDALTLHVAFRRCEIVRHMSMS
eukprot:gene5294-3797_t